MTDWLSSNAVTLVTTLFTLLVAAGGLIWRFSALLSTLTGTLEHLRVTLDKLSDDVRSLDRRLDRHERELAVLKDRADRAPTSPTMEITQ